MLISNTLVLSVTYIGYVSLCIKYRNINLFAIKMNITTYLKTQRVGAYYTYLKLSNFENVSLMEIILQVKFFKSCLLLRYSFNFSFRTFGKISYLIELYGWNIQEFFINLCTRDFI